MLLSWNIPFIQNLSYISLKAAIYIVSSTGQFHLQKHTKMEGHNLYYIPI